MPVTNDDDLREIIQQSHRIAVVGLSSNPFAAEQWRGPVLQGQRLRHRARQPQ